MRTKTIKLFFLSAASVAFTLVSCSHSSGNFETDSKTGVIYRFIKHNDNGVKGTDSDFAKLILSYSEQGKDGKDSILFDSRKRGDSTGSVTIALKKTFNGSLEQGILMMSPGDSAEFQINADSLYTKTFHAPPDRLPAGVTGTTIYTFHITLVSFISKKELMDEQMKERQKMMEKMMARKGMEAPAIAEYLKNNHFENVKPDKDSIFFLQIEQKGSGKQIKEGDSVVVNYVGTLLDGTAFDPAPGNGGPGYSTIKLEYSKDQSVIKVIRGWINVLGNMREGEKAKVLLPSSMAYGPRSMGPIQAFSPLVFDMTVVSVKSNK